RTIITKVFRPRLVSAWPSGSALSCRSRQRNENPRLTNMGSSICLPTVRLPNENKVDRPIHLEKIRPKIRPQVIRDPNRTISLLVRFNQGRKEPRQGRARTVQGMAKAILPRAVLEAQIHPARLEILKIGTAGNFQVTVLSRGPNLEVIGLGGTKPEI